MKKKIALSAIFVLLLTCNCLAVTLLTEEEALANFLPNADEVAQQKIIASDQQLSVIKGNLGGKLVHILKGDDAIKINQRNEWLFYLAKQKNKLTNVAIILEETGKWGPIKFFVKLDPEGKISDIAVMKYTETRGRPVASRSFLRQFSGKALNDPIKVDNDIVGISGATISSDAACFVAKKAMLLYKILILNSK